MCQILTVRFDRKTWSVIGTEIRESDEVMDYGEVAEAYAEKYLKENGEER
jgi:hypothetical protein